MKLKVLLGALLGCTAAVGVQAQTTDVSKEITGYRNMTVTMAGTPSDCNLKDTNLLKTQLSDKLSGIGITQKDQSYAGVELLITAQKFGGPIGHCATMVELVFVGAIGKDNFVTGDEQLKAAIDRMKVVPVVFYKDGRMGVQAQTQPSSGGESMTTEKAVLRMIDDLVENLKAKRQ